MGPRKGLVHVTHILDGAGRREESGLAALFRPSSVAVIGASDDPARIGGRPLKYLHDTGFAGEVFPVNPRRETVQGCRAFAAVKDVPGAIDLAIIALPADRVTRALEECGEVGVRAAIIFSSGFAEVGEDGAARQAQLQAIQCRTGMRILGPNCLGVMNSRTGLLATFASMYDYIPVPPPGSIAFASQSGAVGAHVLAVCMQRGVGFSSWAATGNEADIDFADCIHHFAEDPDTAVIVGYMEGCRDGGRLEAALSHARSEGKPVIMLKVGTSDAGASAVASHTGALVGADAAFEAIFRKYGVHRAASIDEMIDVAEAAAAGRFAKGDGVGILTISGGAGILLADAAEESGLLTPPMPGSAQASMLEVLPFSAVSNPVDATAQVLNEPQIFARFLEIILSEGGFDSIIIFIGYVALSPPLMAAIRGPLHDARTQHPDQPIVLCALVDAQARAELRDDGILVISDPAAAIRVLAALRSLGGSTAAPPVEAAAAAAVPDLPLGELGEFEVKQLLREAGIPVLPEAVVHDEGGAVAAAAEIGGPVVMKIASPRIRHKTEVGGVLLDVKGEESVREAFRTLMDRAGALANDGVLVAPLAGPGSELILGITHDEVFGPLIAVGAGGTAAEAIGDVVVRIPPLSEAEAREALLELRTAELLTGWRGGPPADLDAVARAVSRLSHIAVAWRDDVESLEINPLRAFPLGDGVAALDALLIRRDRRPEIEVTHD